MFMEKLTAFMAILESEMNSKAGETLNRLGRESGQAGYHMIGFDKGQRFYRVWDTPCGGKGVRFFVEVETGKIFGAKSWKAYNPNREYGTLDTTAEWDWSDYSPKSKTGKDSLVPKAERSYCTPKPEKSNSPYTSTKYADELPEADFYGE